MRQPHRSVIVALLLADRQIMRNIFACIGIKIQDTSLHGYPLCKPNSSRICPTQIPKRIDRPTFIPGHLANPPFSLQLSQFLGINGPVKNLNTLPFPNIQVVVFVPNLITLHLLPKHLGKPRIVPPRRMYNNTTLISIQHKPLIRIIILKLRIKRHPYLRTLFPNSRNQNTPTMLANFNRLFHPAIIHTFIRLDLCGIVSDSLKRELTTIGTVDTFFLDSVELA